jgi:hypothetical protein
MQLSTALIYFPEKNNMYKMQKTNIHLSTPQPFNMRGRGAQEFNMII